ncbi:alcohol dehydrogenase catalytic domain-containing protein [Chloroflexota bacterium]
MRAIGIIEGLNKAKIMDLEKPQIHESNDVLIEVKFVGISEIDRRFAQGETFIAPEGFDFLILGHEVMGRVIEVGPSVVNLQIGDNVVLTSRRNCGKCTECERDNTDLCLSGLYSERGIRGAHGFMAEYILEKEKYIVKIPEAIEDIAILLSPLSIAEKIVTSIVSFGHRMDNPKPWPEHAYHDPDWGMEKTAVVVGGNSTAILTALLLRLKSVNTFLLSNRIGTSKIQRLVESAGIKYYETSVNESCEHFSQKIGRTDTVIDCSGEAEFNINLLDLLGNSGAFVTSTIPSINLKNNVNINRFMLDRLIRNQGMFGCISANRRYLESAINDLILLKEQFTEPINGIITDKIPFSNYESAFSALENTSIKVILTMD